MYKLCEMKHTSNYTITPLKKQVRRSESQKN
jgi:hypothetical protein